MESLVQGHQPLILGANQAWRNSQNAEQTEADTDESRSTSVVSGDTEHVEASSKLITDVLGEDGTLTLRISWFSQNPDMDGDQMGIVTFGDEDFAHSRPLSDIPGDLLVQLLQIAQKGEPS